jgi:hypothetical protein
MRHRNPTFLAPLLVAMLALPPKGAASVTVNITSGNAQFVNDDDNGLYITDGQASRRKATADVYRHPVASDNQNVRWPPCTSSPCTTQPVPTIAPGKANAKVIRKLTPVELDFFKDLQKKEQVTRAISRLRTAMALSAAMLKDAATEDVQAAMQPTRDALASVENKKISYAVKAKQALVLSDRLVETRRFIKRAEDGSKGMGVIIVQCDAANELVNAFNEDAGRAVVDYRFNGGLFFKGCKYREPVIENAMLAHIRRLLTQ